MNRQRYFEFIRGSSRKFWRVAWKGNLVTVRWGRIGTDGQVKARKHRTDTEARVEVESLCGGKLAKGYREKKPPKEIAAKPAAGKAAGRGFGALERGLVLDEPFRLAAGWEKSVLKATGLARMPPSYRDYVQRLGRAAGEWVTRRKQKRLPHHLAVHILPGSFASARKLLVTVLDMAAEMGEPELAAKSRGLIVFGDDTSRCFYCWDPARTDKRGEPAIVLLDNYSDLRLTTIAKDFYDLMRNYKQDVDDFTL